MNIWKFYKVNIFETLMIFLFLYLFFMSDAPLEDPAAVSALIGSQSVLHSHTPASLFPPLPPFSRCSEWTLETSEPNAPQTDNEKKMERRLGLWWDNLAQPLQTFPTTYFPPSFWSRLAL